MESRPGQPFAGLVSSILLLPGQPEGMQKRRSSLLIPSSSGLVQPLPDWNSLDLAGAFGNEVSPAVTGLVGYCTAAGSFSAVPIGECRPPSHTGTLVHSRRHPALSEIGLKMNKGEA